MNALFSTLDLGMSTYAVSGSLIPPGDLRRVFSQAHGQECTEGIERLLLAFKKRCTMERSEASTPRIIFRISPNMFTGAVTEETITAAVTRLMEAAGIDPEGESPGALDAVELCWWDEELADPVPTLRQLAAMCKDETAMDEESGEVTITGPKKIVALGVSGMSAEYVVSASRVLELHSSRRIPGWPGVLGVAPASCVYVCNCCFNCVVPSAGQSKPQSGRACRLHLFDCPLGSTTGHRRKRL
jgi:hypothetical protein